MERELEKKIEQLEIRIADLESKVQNQLDIKGFKKAFEQIKTDMAQQLEHFFN